MNRRLGLSTHENQKQLKPSFGRDSYAKGLEVAPCSACALGCTSGPGEAIKQLMAGSTQSADLLRVC